jgi:hypothetical protein
VAGHGTRDEPDEEEQEGHGEDAAKPVGQNRGGARYGRPGATTEEAGVRGRVPAFPAVLLVAAVACAHGPAKPLTSPAPSVLATAPSPTPTPSPRPSPTPSPTPSAGITLTLVPRKGGDAGRPWTATYGTLHGLPTGAAARANATLTAAVQEVVDARDPDTTTDVTLTLSAVDDVYVTVELFAYTYPKGAAHGIQDLTPYVLRRADGRRLTLPDFFRPGSRDAALRAMSGYARQRLPQVVETDAQTVEGGTRPTVEDFAAVTPLPEGLEVVFQPYQVAAYAFGMPRVVVPWSRLASYVAVPLPPGDADPPYRDGVRLTGTDLAAVVRAAAADPRAGSGLARVEEAQGLSDDARSWALGTMPGGDLVALHLVSGRWRVLDAGPAAGCTAFPAGVRTAFALRCG